MTTFKEQKELMDNFFNKMLKILEISTGEQEMSQINTELKIVEPAVQAS